MGTFDDSLTRMRRFLRDPGGLIWSDEDLMDYFNEAQLEIAQKTRVLERVEAHRYPPEFTYSYMFDWEREYCEGDTYQCLLQNQADGSVITSPWESAYWMDTCDSVDDGMRFTHPWESAYCDSADAVPVALHAKFHRMKFCAFDNQEITPVSQDELARQDRFYKTRTGKVVNYYRPDEEGNLMVPYPQPATVVWQEYDYTETLVDTGGVVASSEEWLQETEAGIIIDYIDSSDALFMVYQSMPNNIAEVADESDFPAWMVRVIEHATLERAFGADTDGFIPTLRDYWKLRKEIGIKAIEKFRRLKLTDREFTMGIPRKRGIYRHPTLGDHYPRQWP